MSHFFEVKLDINTDKVKQATQAAIDRALEICGGKAESYAKQLCPVDTGNLRNSITHEKEDDRTEVIGSNVEYAPYVELGTYRMKARPYIRPAIENHVKEYVEVFERELSKIE